MTTHEDETPKAADTTNGRRLRPFRITLSPRAAAETPRTTETEATGDQPDPELRTGAEDVEVGVTPGPVRPGPVGPELVDPTGRLTSSAVRRLALLATLLVLLGGGTGGLVALLLPETFAARAEILYPISTEQPTGFLREDRNLTTQALVLQSRTILAPVAAGQGMSVEDLTERVTATVVEGSELLSVEVRDRSRDRGVAILDQITARYLEDVGRDDRAGVRDYLERQLTDVRARLARARDPEATPATRAGAASLADRESALSEQLDELNVFQMTSPGPSVVVPPYSVPEPVSPGVLTASVTGGLVGLVVAATAVGFLGWSWLRKARAGDAGSR